MVQDPEMDFENDEDVLIDLDGVKYEMIDFVELDGREYVALLPQDAEENDDGDVEFTILEMTDDPDDEENFILKTIDDDELYNTVGEEFLKKFGELDEDSDEE